VIARPFTGQPGAFTRTANRRDFTVEPVGETWLDRVVAAGKTVFGVGKIVDIFSGKGISDSVHTGSDAEGMRVTSEALRGRRADVVFTNLVDFDSKYGHRNDPAGYAKNLASLDSLVPDLLAAMEPEDLLIVTADHGCEATDASTDHTREYVPLLVAGGRAAGDRDLGIRRGFADLAATAGEWMGVPSPRGESFL
jgi:phosphopentomutase